MGCACTNPPLSVCYRIPARVTGYMIHHMRIRVRAITHVPSIAFNILEGVMDIKKRGLFHYFLADPLDPELTSPSALGLHQIDTDKRRQ